VRKRKYGREPGNLFKNNGECWGPNPKKAERGDLELPVGSFAKAVETSRPPHNEHWGCEEKQRNKGAPQRGTFTSSWGTIQPDNIVVKAASFLKPRRGLGGETACPSPHEQGRPTRSSTHVILGKGRRMGQRLVQGGKRWNRGGDAGSSSMLGPTWEGGKDGWWNQME